MLVFLLEFIDRFLRTLREGQGVKDRVDQTCKARFIDPKALALTLFWPGRDFDFPVTRALPLLRDICLFSEFCSLANELLRWPPGLQGVFGDEDMNDSEKIREQLLMELADLREQVARLKVSTTEERYRKLAESTTDIIYILDKEGALLYANQSAAACIGFRQAEIAGKRQEDLFPPEMAKQHIEWIRRVLETGEAVEYDELFHFGPREIWLSVRLIPLLNEEGKVDSVMGVCRDITDRKQAEQELTKSRAILQATIECLPFDFFALGPDGRYILQNATCKGHLGDYIGKTPEEICPNKEDLAIWLDNNRRAFSGEKVEGDACFSYQGDKRFFHNVITPIRSGETLYGILGVNIDITDRKRAEEALQKAHDELEQRVKERTAELLKSNEELAIFKKFAEAWRKVLAFATSMVALPTSIRLCVRSLAKTGRKM